MPRLKIIINLFLDGIVVNGWFCCPVLSLSFDSVFFLLPLACQFANKVLPLNSHQVMEYLRLSLFHTTFLLYLPFQRLQDFQPLVDILYSYLHLKNLCALRVLQSPAINNALLYLAEWYQGRFSLVPRKPCSNCGDP